MSIRLMTGVWDLELPHHQQLVLLILADYADDLGQRCYPSVPRIAWRATYSEGWVRSIMSELRKSGLIVPVANETGGRGMAVEYHIHLEKGTKKRPFGEGEETLLSPDETLLPADETLLPASGTETLLPEKPYCQETETLLPPDETLLGGSENPTVGSSPTTSNHHRSTIDPPESTYAPKNHDDAHDPEETETETVSAPPAPPPRKPRSPEDVPPPGLLADLVEILATLPGWAKHGRASPDILAWLEKSGIDLSHAVETATALKAKWGGKGWTYHDPWATFQTWVKRPPLHQPTGGANGFTSGDSDPYREQRERRERLRATLPT